MAGDKGRVSSLGADASAAAFAASSAFFFSLHARRRSILTSFSSSFISSAVDGMAAVDGMEADGMDADGMAEVDGMEADDATAASAAAFAAACFSLHASRRFFLSSSSPTPPS